MYCWESWVEIKTLGQFSKKFCLYFDGSPCCQQRSQGRTFYRVPRHFRALNVSLRLHFAC